MSGLPQFLVVGAQKAGTTTLQTLLQLHPKVFLPNPKEVQYFSLHYSEGLNWYRNCFAAAAADQYIGEITPYYLFHPFAAERIKANLGPVKIIILLRDPVARTISHYRHACRLGFESLSLIEALANETRRLEGAEKILRLPNGRHQQHQECSYLSRSLYRHQIERYWENFGRDNVLLLPSEKLFAAPWTILMSVFRFLNLPLIVQPDHSLLAAHSNASPSINQLVVSYELRQYIRRQLEDSYDFSKDNLGWDVQARGIWQ